MKAIFLCQIFMITLIPILGSRLVQVADDAVTTPLDGMNDIAVEVQHGIGVVNRRRRTAVKGEQYRWKDAVVPYTVALPVYSERNLKEMREALDEFEKETCLKFVRANQSTPNYVVVRGGPGGCQAELGKVPNEKRGQYLNLGGGCRWYGLYLHEFGHSLGLNHEHQHPDRDRGITVFRNNVQPNMRIWFDKLKEPIETFGAPYDMQSIMHYEYYAFGKEVNGKPLETMRAKDPKMQKYLSPVWLKDMSFYDAWKLNGMYKCAAHCGRVSCNGGYVTKDCKCETKENFARRRCYNKDDDRRCKDWATKGECKRNKIFMVLNCRKACGRCYEAV